MLYSLTTKYCVMALAELARREPDRGIRVKEIAEATGIPGAFLARLIPPLVKAGFVTSKRGRNGGLRLACPADAISLGDVVLITEGKIFFEDCLLTLDSCDGTKGCPQHGVWRQIREQMVAFLDGTTIQDVARARRSDLAVEAKRALRPQKRVRGEHQV